MYSKTDVDYLENKCYRVLNLSSRDPNLNFPKILPICILEAVFSIGARSKSAHNVWDKYIRYYNIDENSIDTHTISDFINNYASFPSVDNFIKTVIQNRQRTSAKNGILKAQAALDVALAFKRNGFETISDFNDKSRDHTNLDYDICSVHGMKSGVMLKYLYMLAGDENTAKPDRMLLRFLSENNPSIIISDVPSLMTELSTRLAARYPHITVRCLDYLMWDYQRSIKH